MLSLISSKLPLSWSYPIIRSLCYLHAWWQQRSLQWAQPECLTTTPTQVLVQWLFACWSMVPLSSHLAWMGNNERGHYHTWPLLEDRSRDPSSQVLPSLDDVRRADRAMVERHCIPPANSGWYNQDRRRKMLSNGILAVINSAKGLFVTI